MPLKAQSIGIRELDGAITSAIKALPKELVAGPKKVIRPEIIGIILRERLEFEQALDVAETITKSLQPSFGGAPMGEAAAISRAPQLEAGVLVTRGGILAGFFPVQVRIEF